MIIRKSPMEVERLHAAGQLVGRILAALRAQVRPGMTTMDLERRALAMIRVAGAKAAFKGYWVPVIEKRYLHALCTSVNHEVVHGVPSRRRVLREGDIVKVDCGVLLDGYYGDSATTIPIGTISPAKRRLLRVTRGALDLAVASAVEGRRVHDMGGMVQRYVERHGFSVVRDFAGHGIGRKLHEDPVVPNWVDPTVPNVRLRTGMVIAIEPMVAAGAPEIETLRDGFTAVTADRSSAAHFEHCVAVTRNGPRVLTAL